MHDEYDNAAAADRALFHARGSVTAGATAFHQLDPSEITMRLEEFDPRIHAASEKWELRNEIFSGFLEYVFADGPDPENVCARLEGFFQSFHPDLASAISGEKTWVSQEKVAAVLRKHQIKLAAVADSRLSRASLSRWNTELETEVDFECVREMLVELVIFMASEGRDWRRVTAVAYCIAKALRPSLIAGMSLADIAILSGDAGGRATPQNRTKRIFNDRVAAAGFKACHVHFQKSAAVIEKYRHAALGNSNRKKSNKRKTAR